MLVDFGLVGVDLVVADRIDGECAAGDLRLHQAVGQGHGTRALLGIDFGLSSLLDAGAKLVVFNGDQLAVGLGKGEMVLEEPVAAKERGRGFVEAVIGYEVEERLVVYGVCAVEVECEAVARAIAGQVQRAEAAVDGALPLVLAVSCVVFDVLGDRATFEEDGGVGRVVRSGFKLGGHVFLPALIDASWRAAAGVCAAGYGVFADRFVQARLCVGRIGLAEEVLHDVGKVNAHVEEDAAGVFLVPPHGNEHAVAAAYGNLLHQARTPQ